MKPTVVDAESLSNSKFTVASVENTAPGPLLCFVSGAFRAGVASSKS
jgi:hypothetical protein